MDVAANQSGVHRAGYSESEQLSGSIVSSFSVPGTAPWSRVGTRWSLAGAWGACGGAGLGGWEMTGQKRQPLSACCALQRALGKCLTLAMVSSYHLVILESIYKMLIQFNPVPPRFMYP